MEAKRRKFTCWFMLGVFISAGGCAFAQAVPAPVKSGSELWMPVWATLAGGFIGSLLGPIIKEIAMQTWSAWRSEKVQREQIEQSYFAPLSAASEKLIWRMSEIFIDNRAQFLLIKTLPKDYNTYKRLSTLYRIAAVIGWIRALNLELNALPRGGLGASSPVLKALSTVQSALADGHGVEERRFRSFCGKFDIDLASLDKKRLATLSASFEVVMYSLAGDDMKKSHRHLRDSKPLHQEFICRGLVQFLGENEVTHSLDDDKFRQLLPELIECLGYRESLIYREWQEAIGDAMIVKDEHSAARRYRIVGFEEFERMMSAGSFSWAAALRDLVEDVSFEPFDPTDERPKHLRDLAKGVATVLIEIHDKHASIVNTAAVERARQIAALPE